ncbi:hypothetical protein ABZV91_19790 [Nocardia sp. NPDC004568]|uniref:hypothetical protein n=1 Tax=Nocardia sp. NPDC004568 TaxID=3154551 RepID=UPI0033A7AEF8
MVEQVVALGRAERDDWQTARLFLKVDVPDRELERKGHWSDIVVVAVLAEGATNARTVALLTPGVAGAEGWVGEIELDRDHHLDRASLSVYVLATVGGTPGRIIASTERDWIVDMTADAPLRERQLDVSKVSFARSTEWLTSLRDAPWVVDTSGRMPTLRLNSDFDGLEALVDGQGSKAERVMGEMLMAQMCAEVWTAVFHTAVGDLEIEEDGTPLFPADWRGAVLREMLPYVVPGRSEQDALREVHLRREGQGSWADLQPRIQYAAARRADVPKTLATTIRAIERSDEEIV